MRAILMTGGASFLPQSFVNFRRLELIKARFYERACFDKKSGEATMLQYPTSNQFAYEVVVYNRDVRALVKDNQSHDVFGDHWADTQIHDVMAESEDQALLLILHRYPPEQGFVIQKVSVLTH